MDAYRADVEAIVTKPGVCIQTVGGGEENHSFAYTAGLFNFAHPEFLIVGLPHELARDLLHDLAYSVLRSGMTYAPGDRVHRLVNGGFGWLVQVDHPCIHLRTACALHDRRNPGGDASPVSALQVVFADRYDHWPWEAASEHPELRCLAAIHSRTMDAIRNCQTHPSDEPKVGDYQRGLRKRPSSAKGAPGRAGHITDSRSLTASLIAGLGAPCRERAPGFACCGRCV